MKAGRMDQARPAAVGDGRWALGFLRDAVPTRTARSGRAAHGAGRRALGTASGLLLALLVLLLWPAAGWAQTPPPPAPGAGGEIVEYYATDALGSIRVVFTAAGAEVARADYLPFGERFTATGPLPPQQYTGQQRDPEAQLDHFNARSYQTTTGRFTGMDPAYDGVRHPQRWNRYSYGLNNPLRYTDPDGRNPAVVIALGAAVGAAANTVLFHVTSNQNQRSPRNYGAAALGGAISGAGTGAAVSFGGYGLVACVGLGLAGGVAERGVSGSGALEGKSMLADLTAGAVECGLLSILSATYTEVMKVYVKDNFVPSVSPQAKEFFDKIIVPIDNAVEPVIDVIGFGGGYGARRGVLHRDPGPDGSSFLINHMPFGVEPQGGIGAAGGSTPVITATCYVNGEPCPVGP